MKGIISRYVESLKNKTFETEALLKHIQTGHPDLYDEKGYKGFFEAIKGLEHEAAIAPVKASGRFYMTPPLFCRYRRTGLLDGQTLDKAETEVIKNEIMCLNPGMDKQYYLAHPGRYIEKREQVRRLNDWLNRRDAGGLPVGRNTINERSFEIFNDEKYLAQKGIGMLSNLGLTLEDLNCYKTYEAFFYILFGGCRKGNALVVENKDTFMSLLHFLQKNGQSLHRVRINILVYGEGKKIVKSFEFMEELKRHTDVDKVYYWGDLDFTGIEIFTKLMGSYPGYRIVPMVDLYRDMIENADEPPIMRARQNRVPIDGFLEFFDGNTRDRIREIILGGRYIPQEAVSFGER